MLEVLCGNKTVQHILIFLFVNGKCYGTEVHKALKISLTPIQKALDRLEKGGLITSYYEGKTRLYQFNEAYPLISEVEQLLKKAYTLLTADKKKAYYRIKNSTNSTAASLNKTKILMSFWEKLMSVTKLKVHASTRSKEGDGWNNKGQGEVFLTKEGSNVLIFTEKGSWQDKEGIDVSFSNVFRWTIDLKTSLISLEHLRFGVDRPVFLFHLTPNDKNSLSSVNSHLCGGDSYFGQIRFDQYSLCLNWRVIGPKKNEEIDYFYN